MKGLQANKTLLLIDIDFSPEINQADAAVRVNRHPSLRRTEVSEDQDKVAFITQFHPGDNTVYDSLHKLGHTGEESNDFLPAPMQIGESLQKAKELERPLSVG